MEVIVADLELADRTQSGVGTARKQRARCAIWVGGPTYSLPEINHRIDERKLLRSSSTRREQLLNCTLNLRLFPRLTPLEFQAEKACDNASHIAVNRRPFG
ncbi:MAG TPA: hypothetical protein VK821_10790, partial [Dehalococcoidia bacterium]|nr:hypothetical protein [Dehalococcoidia bacterium]